MLTSEALPIIGVPPVPIGVVWSIGIRRSPLRIDGITPATRKSAPSLTAFAMLKKNDYEIKNVGIIST